MEMGHVLLVEVDDEVLLALKLPGELLGGHEAEGPLFRLRDLVGIHAVYFRNYRKTRRRFDDWELIFPQP